MNRTREDLPLQLSRKYLKGIEAQQQMPLTKHKLREFYQFYKSNAPRARKYRRL